MTLRRQLGPGITLAAVLALVAACTSNSESAKPVTENALPVGDRASCERLAGTRVSGTTIDGAAYVEADGTVFEYKPFVLKAPASFCRVTVSGRMENALFYDNDEGVRDFVHPLMLTDFIAPSLIGWQAVVTGPTGLTLRLLFEESASAETRERSGALVLAQMNRIFKTKRMTRVQVTLEVVESLPVDPKTGKYRLVVNESAAT